MEDEGKGCAGVKEENLKAKGHILQRGRPKATLRMALRAHRQSPQIRVSTVSWFRKAGTPFAWGGTSSPHGAPVLLASLPCRAEAGKSAPNRLCASLKQPATAYPS